MGITKGGIGFNKQDKKSQKELRKENAMKEDGPQAAKIDMDIYDKEGDQQRKEEEKELELQIDKEEKAFLAIFKRDDPRGGFQIDQRAYEHFQSLLTDGVSVAQEEAGRKKLANVIDMTG